jgi:hypothetical protein
VCLPPVFLLLVELVHQCLEEYLHRLLVVVALQQTQVHLAICIQSNNHGDTR